MKIGMLGKGYITWGGGIDFLKAYINALRTKSEIEIVLFLPEPSIKDILKSYLRPWKNFSNNIFSGKGFSFPKREKINLNEIVGEFLLEYPDLKIIRYQDDLYKFIKVLRKEKIDIIFPSIESLGKDFPFPWIGYIYDFQHKYYPEFFSVTERENRNKSFNTILRESKAVVVNAENVKDDIRKFHPGLGAAVYAMPFSPVPRADWLSGEGDLEKYNLPQKYFMISNQFWVHKNHGTAFEALALLHKREKYRNVHIVCTGNTYDYRDPNYFQKLQAQIIDLGIQQYIHFLGYISKLDQVNIMRNSLAVLQPTLFEGGPGGGAVYDAVALGVNAIVSDIPVNKEIKDKLVSFFSVKSSADLENKMVNLLDSNIKDNKLGDDQLLKLGDVRLRHLADSIVEMLQVVLEDKKDE